MLKESTNSHVIDRDQYQVVYVLRNLQGIISLVRSHILVLAIFENLSQFDTAA